MTTPSTRLYISAVPANSSTIVVLDSTHGLARPLTTTPGPFRGRWGASRRVRGTIKPVGQAVTVTVKLLTGTSGTSADWETDTSATTGGVWAIAAGTTYIVDYLAPCEFQFTYTAGATAPTSIDTNLRLVSPNEER